MTGAVIRYEEARRALQAAVKPTQAKLIRDKVLALETYARQAMDRDIEVWAAEIRVRAERRLGELLLEAAKHPGGRPKTGAKVEPVIATLEKLGITKKLSSFAQRLAAVPEETFESYIKDCQLMGEPPRSAILVRNGRGKMAVHHSSASDEHYTPTEIVKAVQSCFGGGIDLDPCSNTGTPNVPASRHYTKHHDGLRKPWHGNVFVNPPYGDAVPHWVDKAITEYMDGRAQAIILLLAARPDTGWFYALRDFPVCFIRGRLQFVGNSDAAPFPSALFWLSEGGSNNFVATFNEIGTVYGRIYG